jgi:hypothetical protein
MNKYNRMKLVASTVSFVNKYVFYINLIYLNWITLKSIDFNLFNDALITKKYVLLYYVHTITNVRNLVESISVIQNVLYIIKNIYGWVKYAQIKAIQTG